MENETETTTAEVEENETEVSTPSPEDKESSNDTTEPEKETETTTEPEKAEPEETFEQKVDRLATSKADKSLKTYQKKLADLEAEKAELTAQVTEKTWDRNMKDLFDEESESLGEDVAKKRKADREKVKTQVLEFQKNGAYVEKTKPVLEAKEASLNVVERNQGVRERLWGLFFPDDKRNLTAYNEAVKKFDKTNDWDEVDIIFEGIKESFRVKSTHKPDSGQQGGGGGDDISNLPIEQRADALFKRAEEKAKKK